MGISATRADVLVANLWDFELDRIEAIIIFLNFLNIWMNLLICIKEKTDISSWNYV